MPAALMKVVVAVIGAVAVGAIAWVTGDPAVLAQLTGRAAPASGGHTAIDSADFAMQAKLEGPITCINRTLTHLETARRTYVAAMAAISHAAPAQAPSINLADRPMFKIEPYERDNEFALGCADALDKSAALPPAIADLDGASRQLAPLLRTIVPLGNQAEIYYGQEDWKDDQFQKGRQIDTKLGPKLAALTQQDDILRAGVLREQAALRERELDTIEKAQGRTYEWHALDLMYTARQMMDLLGAAARGRTLTEVDVAGAISPFQAEFDAGTAYSAAHQEEAKPDVRGMRPLWFDLQPSATALLQQAKDLRRRLPTLTGQGDAARQEGQALDTINMTFNGLVDTYNTVSRFR